MRFAHLFVQASLLLAAVFHLLPAVGALGSQRLASLYGVPVEDPALLLLMRHRALLFAVIGVALVFAARVQPGTGPSPTPNPGMHPGYVQVAAIVLAMVTTGGFVALAWGQALNPALVRVMWVDAALFLALTAALAVRVLLLR